MNIPKTRLSRTEHTRTSLRLFSLNILSKEEGFPESPIFYLQQIC